MQVEQYMEIANMIFRIVNIIVNAWLIGLFAKPFLRDKKMAVGIMVSYMCVMIFLLLIPYEMSGMTAYSIGVAVSYSALLVADRYNIYQKIFLGVITYLIRWIASGIILEPWNVIWKLTVERFADNDRSMQFGMFLFAELMYVFLDNIIMYIMFKIIHRIYHNKKEIMKRRELFLLLSPYFSIVSGYMVIDYLVQIYETDTNYYIWNEHIGYRGLVIIFQIISYMAIIAGIISYGRVKAQGEDELQQAVMAEQIKDMKNHVDSVEALYKDIRGIKHDIGNHILVLEDLLERGNKKEAGEFLADMRSDYVDTGITVKTGNPVTDVIIDEKQKESKQKGVEMSCKFVFPENTGISTYDVSVILGNVLSNAMEAAGNSKEKYMEVSSLLNNQIYFINVKNSYDGVLDIDEETGLPITTKEGNDVHGLGLRNVKKVAEKYYGAVKIRQEKGEVITTVMLVLPA